MLDNASSAGIRVNTIVLAFTLVAGTVVFLRLFTRLVLTKGAGFEDVCIAFAMVLSIALAVTTSEQVMHGLGKHLSDLSDEEATTSLKMFWASLWIYNLALSTTKVAILVQYIRIFPIRHFRCVCYALLCIVIACGAWGVFANVFICYPVGFLWDPTVKDGRCINNIIVWFTTAGLNIFQDIVILFLPIRVIRSLSISKSQKKGLVTMFGLGASVIVISTVRLYSLDSLSDSNDQTFDNIDQATLSGVEVNVGIICACLPVMRPLFAIMLPKYFDPAAAYSTVPANDIERPKEFRAASISTRVGTPTQHVRLIYSRNGSSPSQASLEPRPSTSGHNSQSTQHRSVSAVQSHNLSATHSRNGSSLSIAVPRSNFSTARPFQGSVLNPLRMSPVTPYAAPTSLRLGRLPEDNNDVPDLAPGAYSRRPSEASINLTRMPTSRRRPRTPVSTKPLPLTPFPVGSGDWTQMLTAIPRPEAPKAEAPKAEAQKTETKATEDA